MTRFACAALQKCLLRRHQRGVRTKFLSAFKAHYKKKLQKYIDSETVREREYINFLPLQREIVFHIVLARAAKREIKYT
jgi:hypothetical protein